jgi:hypothetical protein
MRRRAFIGFIGGAVAWPLVACAPQGEPIGGIGMLVGSEASC